MGEVNVAMDELDGFFADHGDALHLQLGFLVNQRLWLALARGEAAPLEDLIRACRSRRRLRLGDVPAQPRRAHARQAHRAERDEVFAAFAPDEDMRSTGTASAAGPRRCSAATARGCGWRGR